MTTCRAIATTTNQPCKNKVSKNKVKEGDYYCHLHKHRPAADNDANNCDHTVSADAATCQGIRLDGQPWVFCRFTHDPANRENYVSPKVFNDGTVSLDWDGRDAYNPLVTLKRDKTSEIDHVIEKQIGSAVVGDVLRAGMVDKCHRSYLVELVGELVVNRKDNLRYTQKQTNLLKGAAVSNILNDYYSDGNVHPSGLTGYIRLQAKLGREETALINEVMEKAWKSCLRRLEGEGDSPELGAVELKLRYLRDVMKFA